MKKGLLLAVLAALSLAQDRRDLRLEPASRLNPLRDAGTRWAMVVGISSYQHLPPGAQLRYAHRDGEDFAAFLRTAAGGAIPGDHIKVLSNETPSCRAQTRKAIECL